MTARRPYGFTLLEVLIALAVSTLGMLAVTLAAATAGRNAVSLREQTLAHWVALNRATEMRLEPAWPDIGRTDGDVDFAGTQWRWFAEVSETDVEALRRVEISVAYAQTPDDSITGVVAFIGRPVQGQRFRPWTGTIVRPPGPR